MDQNPKKNKLTKRSSGALRQDQQRYLKIFIRMQETEGVIYSQIHVSSTALPTLLLILTSI